MVTMAWGTKIQTAANPALTATLPRFASEEEAKRYGRWLARKEYLQVLAHETFATAGPLNATFPKGARSLLWTRDEG